MCPRLASEVAAPWLRIQAEDAEEESPVVELSRVVPSLEISCHLDELIARFALHGGPADASDEKADGNLLPVATPSDFHFHMSQLIKISTARSRVLRSHIRSLTNGHPTTHRNSAVAKFCSCAFARIFHVISLQSKKIQVLISRPPNRC